MINVHDHSLSLQLFTFSHLSEVSYTLLPLLVFQGNSANLLNYQIYLLEGLSRWNQDRAAAAVTSEPSTLRTYTGELVHCVNRNYEKVFGRKLVPGFSPPAEYTGSVKCACVHCFYLTLGWFCHSKFSNLIFLRRTHWGAVLAEAE